MNKIKEVGSKLINSPIGAVAGALGGFWASKKYLKVSNKWALAGLTIVGAVIGAGAEATIKAKFVKPAAAAKK